MNNFMKRLVLSLLVVTAFGVGVAVRPVIVDDAIAADSQTIPKSWGTLKGAALGALIFEDSEGTIRLAKMDNGKLYMTFTRQ